MDTCMHGGVSAKDENEWQTVFNKRQSNRREKSQDIPDGTKAATKLPTRIGSTLQRRPSGRSGPGSGHSSRSSSKPSSRHHSTSDAGSPHATIMHEQSAGKGDHDTADVKQLKPSRDLLQAVSQDMPREHWRWVFRELMKKASKNGRGREEILIQNIEAKYDKDLDEQKFQALLMWLNSTGSKATIFDLDKALRKNDCASVADKHTTCGVPIVHPTDGASVQSGSDTGKDTASSTGKSATGRSKNPVMEPLVTTTVAVQESADGPVVKKKTASPEFEVRRVSVDESNIQISQEGNKITFSMPSHLLQKCKAGAESSSYDDKSCIAAQLIANIINPNDSKRSYKMKLSELACRFQEKYGTHLKFRNLGVGKLKPFIDQSDCFTLFKDDSSDEYIVEQTAPTPSPSADSGVSSMFNNRESHANNDSGSEYEYGTAMPSVSETPFRTPDGSARKILNPIPIDIEIGINECLSAELLGSLLKKPPSRCLKFVLETEYQDKLKFTHDIVSLWNTPEPQTRYIVVGVSPKRSPPHEHVGVTDIKQDKYYQDLFREEAFSYKPRFKYSELLYEGKRYGVFVMPNSKGYGEPCYAESNDPSGRWQQDNICHCTPKNTNAGRKSYQRIIKWFAGSLSEMPSSPKETLSEEWNKEWDYIKSHVAGLARDRIPSLVLSRCNPDTRYLGSLGNFPWVKVWDFDPQSKASGVLKACLQEGASDRIKVSTWKDKVGDPNSDGTTDWVFVRGIEDIAESLIDAKEPRKWYGKIKRSLHAHCNQLAQHCQSKEKPAFVVVLWYDNFEYIGHLERLLQKIDDEMEDAEFLLIMPNLPRNKVHLENLRSQVGIERIAQIPLANLCHNLYHCACPFQSDTGGTYMLPVSNGTYDADINDQEFHWYKEEIEILYSSPASQEMWHQAKLGERFFAGGLLQWSDCELGMIDGKRSLYKPLMQNVMNYLRTQKSTIIKLFYEPSSGGTTLGRRILWDLHLMTPCACVGATTFKAKQVLERLESLYEKTQLPIVLLVDGADEKLVKEVESDERYQKVPIVILHIQQHSGEIGGKVHGANQHLLTAKVDYMEAMSLLHVFSHSCSKETLVKLRKLVEDVKEGKPRDMHEFKQVHEVQKG